MQTAANKRTTLKDLADMLGVSKTIVSKVINNHPQVRVGKELRQKILTMADQLNYSPLRSAQALTTQKTGQVAFLLSDKTTLGLANSYYARILAGVNETCRKRGYHCIVDVYDMSSIEGFVLPENIKTRNIDGCILLGLLNDLVMDKFTNIDIPTVAIGGRADKQTIPVVTNNLPSFIHKLYKYFYRTGHHKIWLGYGNASRNTKQIVNEITKEYADMDTELVDSKCAEGSYNEFDYGKDVAEQWAALPCDKRPTIVYGTDQMCVGFSSTIQRMGFNCPGDVSIIGGVDSELVKWYSPPITAFSSNNCYQYGLQGSALLLDIIEGIVNYSDAFQIAESIKVSSDIIERESVFNMNVNAVNKAIDQ